MKISRHIGRAMGIRPMRVEAPEHHRDRVPPGTRAAVVGAGVAGVSAAVVLAERGVDVRLLEAGPVLGGRLSAVPYELPDGTGQQVDHGFHAFFRQYYNLRAILHRIDPLGRLLRPVDAYPVISERWPSEDFGHLPAVPPLNLLALLLRSPSLRFRDLRHMDRREATAMLAFDPHATYRDFDAVSAQEFLDRLNLPERSIAMLFEVFAHSFFNRSAEFSAAELLANFHFYFLGNPEGLAFDAPSTDYDSGIWAPFRAYLSARGAQISVEDAAVRIDPADDGWLVSCSSGRVVTCRYLVLALDPPGLRRLVADSPRLAERAPQLARDVSAFGSGPPYAVARYWFDGDVDQRRPVFCGVSRASTLDSITLYHRLDASAAGWAARTGGSVVELHAYAGSDDLNAPEAAQHMLSELITLWPEAGGLRCVELRARVEANAPAFAPGSHRDRPTVRTDADGLFLAGDGIRMDVPGALLERAATTGIAAANEILVHQAVRSEPIWSTPVRGLLARS